MAKGGSEADTIEKLIVPLFERIYSGPLYFERASRSTKGKRKWDLEVYGHCPLMQKKPDKLLALVECKSAQTALHTNKRSQGTAIDLAKLALSPGKSVIQDYMPSSVDAKGDDLLQVWMYAHGSFTERTASSKTVLTNGVNWLVFKEDFFRDVNGNPPSNIPHIPPPQSGPAPTNAYYTQIEFPQCPLQGGDSAALFAWKKSFFALGLELT